MKEISFEEAIKALEDGKMIVEKHTSHETANVWRDEKGVLRAEEQVSQKLYYNVCLGNDTSYYLPEEPKPFEITETGCYKARNGKRIFINYVGNEHCDGVIEGECSDGYWEFDGKESDGDERYDIIGKWGEDE